MNHLNRKKSWQDELWNVSLLPSSELTSSPRQPQPPAAGALATPPLLSIRETVAPEPWLQAA